MGRPNTAKISRDQLLLVDGLWVSFMRTLRIPDDRKAYPLPPGLGRFPIRRVDDYSARVPREWRRRGGVFLPMYQREAMWLHFHAPRGPRAVKVGIGKVCALTGKRWSEELHSRPQDYIVVPDQPWLDGIVVKKGVVRQFVAMPLGAGYTVEGQVTGRECFGGVQLKAFEPKAGTIDWSGGFFRACSIGALPASPAARKRRSGDMGLGVGGRMRQKVYPDRHGVGLWNRRSASRVFVHLVNSELWEEITGEAPPRTPVTARSYADAGLPWYDLYDEGQSTLRPRRKLKKVKSIKELDRGRSTRPLQDDEPVEVGPVHKLWHHLVDRAGAVRDGDW